MCSRCFPMKDSMANMALSAALMKPGGAFSGPRCSSGCYFDVNCPILYVNDSKKLSEKKREELYDEIMEKAVSVGVGIASSETT